MTRRTGAALAVALVLAAGTGAGCGQRLIGRLPLIDLPDATYAPADGDATADGDAAGDADGCPTCAAGAEPFMGPE